MGGCEKGGRQKGGVNGGEVWCSVLFGLCGSVVVRLCL